MQEPWFADRYKEFEAKIKPRWPGRNVAFVVKGLNYISLEGLGFRVNQYGYDNSCLELLLERENTHPPRSHIIIAKPLCKCSGLKAFEKTMVRPRGLHVFHLFYGFISLSGLAT